MDHDELVNKRVHPIVPELGKRNRAIAEAHAESLRAIVTPLAGQTARAIAKALNESRYSRPTRRPVAIAADHASESRKSPPRRPARTSLARPGG